MPSETKSFWKTSEFWVVVVSNLLATSMQIAGTLPPKYGVPAQMVLNGLYAVARGMAKSGVPPER